MGYTRLNYFVAPRKFCGSGPVSKKKRLNLSSQFRGGGGKQVHNYGNTDRVLNHYQPSSNSKLFEWKDARPVENPHVHDWNVGKILKMFFLVGGGLSDAY